MKIENLHPSEIEDLQTELKKHRRSIDEFDISSSPQPLDDTSGSISPYRGTITFKNRRNGTERRYETGHGSKWVVQLSDDLARCVL